MISCGSSFTVAGSTSNNNAVFFWGTKPLKRSRSQTASESASPSQSINSGTRSLKSRKSSLGSFDDSGLEKSASLEKSGSISNEGDAGYFISFHFISSIFVLFHIISDHFISFTAFCFISSHFISYFTAVHIQ